MIAMMQLIVFVDNQFFHPPAFFEAINWGAGFEYISEFRALIEDGLDYMCELDEMKFFRKRK